jgi:hypothetical protein
VSTREIRAEDAACASQEALTLPRATKSFETYPTIFLSDTLGDWAIGMGNRQRLVKVRSAGLAAKHHSNPHENKSSIHESSYVANDPSLNEERQQHAWTVAVSISQCT